MLTYRFLCILFLTSLFHSCIWAKVLCVPQPYPSIKDGIDAASDGDTVLIADGIYTGEGNRDLDFKAKAIFLTSEHGAELTTIDCQGSLWDFHRAFYFHNKETATAVINGLSIRNGYYTSSVGGAILCYGSSPTISECIFEYNIAWLGGAIYCENSTAHIENSRFLNNISTGT